MSIRNHYAGRLGLAAALLVTTSLIAIAQPTPLTVAPAADAETRLVIEADATHVAHLTGATGTGTAWFMADPQNNTLRWTIELDGVNVGGANIACPPGEGAVAGGAGAAPAGTTLAVALSAKIELLPGETAASLAGATPAMPAGGTPATPALATPATPADGTPAMPAVSAATDAMAATEVLDLLEGAGAGDTMNTPLEGEAANLEGPVFAQIEGGACFLNIQTAAATAATTPAAAGGVGATPLTRPAG